MKFETMEPLNIELLIPTRDELSHIKQVTVLDIFEKATKNFHPEGLFSTEIFGRVGEERRNRTFAYIDVKIPLFHPDIYNSIIKLKELYEGIISGNEFAVWDDQKKDFFKSTPLEGDTGFDFFLKHFKELQYTTNKSITRSFYIDVVSKNGDNVFLDKILVLPAGLRDYEVEEGTKPSQDECNDYYRALLSLSNLIKMDLIKMDPRIYNDTRYSLQRSFNNLYDYFMNMMDGKKKMLIGKWASRKVFHSTRNVASSAIFNRESLDDKDYMDVNQTALGLFQFSKGTILRTLFNLKNGFLDRVFTDSRTTTYLVNKKTYKKQSVSITSHNYDKWMSDEGLEATITSFGEEDLRHEYLQIEGYYLGLIYKGPDKTFKIFQDINELPKHLNKKYVTPLTFAELLYTSIAEGSKDIPGTVTRYPAIEYGSLQLSMCYLRSTVPSEQRTLLDDNFEPTDVVLPQFPLMGEKFFDSMAVHITRMQPFGLDHDGDTTSSIPLYTEESKQDVKNTLNNASYYVTADGKLYFSAATSLANLVLSYLTSKPVEAA